ncbi:putative aluminum-activated malate transporter [Helianthus annuus]|nr:putative aluminum-activated malate transporter [Helianthus annuus]KAJ0702359.1 putative aluminum-activated malate transporter [Helianthus annuus]
MDENKQGLLESLERDRMASSALLQNDCVVRDGENRGCFRSTFRKFGGLWGVLRTVVVRAYKMGRSDPRKVVFSAKLGLALSLISLLIFWKEPLPDISEHYVWAILTVVVVFEFSIGATFSKGFNRALGTLSAGGLALAMAEFAHLCERAGEPWDEVVIVVSIFTIGSLATYAKLYPTWKAYEYGFRVFTLTYCYIMASGYRTNEFIDTAVSRFLLIALGAGVSLLVNVGIYPIWAGEDLHNLVVKNFYGVANSLEGCINQYLDCVEYKRIPSKILTYQAHEDRLYSGYRSAVESTSQEDTLLGFAIWEPPHGAYKKHHPWRNFVKVSGALRHCAFMVMALHGCILSEIQAPADRRRVFRDELQRVSTAGAKVLRELGNKVKKMEKLGTSNILDEVLKAAEDLQKKVDQKSYLLVDSNSWEIGKPPIELHDPQDFSKIEDPYAYHGYHSFSETLLDLGKSRSNESGSTNNLPFEGTNGLLHRSLTRQFSLKPERMVILDEADTYKSASVLSLVTFTSLLIEFVARLGNLVAAFEELSEKAKFKAPPVEGRREDEVCGMWTRLCRFLKPRNRNENLLV